MVFPKYRLRQVSFTNSRATSSSSLLPAFQTSVPYKQACMQVLFHPNLFHPVILSEAKNLVCKDSKCRVTNVRVRSLRPFTVNKRTKKAVGISRPGRCRPALPMVVNLAYASILAEPSSISCQPEDSYRPPEEKQARVWRRHRLRLYREQRLIRQRRRCGFRWCRRSPDSLGPPKGFRRYL